MNIKIPFYLRSFENRLVMMKNEEDAMLFDEIVEWGKANSELDLVDAVKHFGKSCYDYKLTFIFLNLFTSCQRVILQCSPSVILDSNY